MAIEVFPVVHVKAPEMALEQTAKSLSCGADGVYLIDHGGGEGKDRLLDVYARAREQHPHEFLGVNFLQFTPLESLRYLQEELDGGNIAELPDGLWVDNISGEATAVEALRRQDKRLSNISLLGGISFKYTPTYSDDPEVSALEAKRLAPYVDVVTTSGPGTGLPPTPEKIAAMKDAIGDQSLAVASGIDAENIASFGGFLDQLLVASSVETKPYSGVFDEAKLEYLIDLAHRL